MSNLYDRTGLSQKQHHLGANLDSQIYFPMLYHCATLSSLLKNTLKNTNYAAELHLYSLLFICICICICIIFFCLFWWYKRRSGATSLLFTLYSLLFICICICICIHINQDFIVTVELFRQWKYRIKAFIVTVEKVRQGQWTPLFDTTTYFLYCANVELSCSLAGWKKNNIQYDQK